jgi:endonuclease/exonuclease/phosphatase family metal-dependent hydrolase
MTVSAVIASYNTHRGVGLDFRFAPRRTARVVRELGADIVALQELTTRESGVDMLEELRRHTGYQAVGVPAWQRGGAQFGNGLLTRFPITSVAAITLDVERREPRSAIDAILDCRGVRLRIVATHLGLRSFERREQIGRLLRAIRAGPVLPTVLLGDLNEWFLRRRALRWLHAHFGETPACATFPSLLPMLALDRIWIAPAQALRHVRVHKTRAARVASDHLPLIAQFELPR